MLSTANRMRTSADFEAAVRGGRRAGSRTVVVHGVVREVAEPARVGFVVSKAVGTAVVRNRVKRRLRHLVRDRVTSWPAGALVVVRANPAAGEADVDRLAGDLDKCWRRLALAGAA